MFVLEWGPDGKLYMSVGNHAINLQGPEKSKTSGRGSSGIIVRMEPDGSKMERLVHGLRVPYSFEYDPFGQLWLLSNGEGNPNRFVRVIDGVDYHCYSRPGVDNNWLAGNHPLAPPCEEIHRGADTQLMRYYGAAYPAEYWGNLFLCNWGAHGFAGPNRGIFRFVPDERNNIVKREPLVWCKDPHFRPAHIILDSDGSLLIADWYGRDDESDMTGRIWRLKYVGKDRPVVKHKLDSPEWKNDDYAISALGSPSHLIREKAMSTIVGQGRKFDLRKLSSHAAKSADPLGAANAIWSLVQIGDGFPLEVYGGTVNPDWKVRRLAIHIGRRYDPASAQRLAEGSANGSIARLLKDKDVAVHIESALALADADAVRFTLTDALMKGAASDRHLRYEAAWRLAHFADDAALIRLLTSDDADVRLAGLIAIDVACYENFPTKRVALEVLAKALVDPRKLDHQLLLDVARLDGDASIVPALEKLIARDDVPTATVAKAFLILKAKAGPAYAVKAQGAGKRFIEAVEKGTLPIKTTTDQLVLFEFLESEGPTPFALKQIGGQLQSSNKEVRLAAHTLARRFGPKASSLAEPLWPSVLNPKTKFEDAIESLSTIARVARPDSSAWSQLLKHDDPMVRMEAVRWWRHLPGKTPYDHLADPKQLLAKDARIADDLGMLLQKWSPIEGLKLPGPEKDKDVLAKYVLKEIADIPDADRTKRAAMGLQVFERNACTKCHTTATATTLLAPSLKGIAQQKLDYLIESVLYPSKIIKTGWEVETIATKDGKVITGLVKDEGKSLRVIQAMDYLGKPLMIDKASIEERSVSKISLMPDGQEATLSRREFVDLIAYLQTLK
jgi:putative heme-binding domain-containing protein